MFKVLFLNEVVMWWLSAGLILDEVSVFQGQTCFNFHPFLRLSSRGLRNLQAFLFMSLIRNVGEMYGHHRVVLFGIYTICSPLPLSHLCNNCFFWTPKNLSCMCADLLGQKSRGTAVTATGKMTSPKGYAKINTSESIYSIPKPPFHFQIFTTASWSLKIKQKSTFDLLSSLKVDFRPQTPCIVDWFVAPYLWIDNHPTFN